MVSLFGYATLYCWGGGKTCFVFYDTVFRIEIEIEIHMDGRIG